MPFSKQQLACSLPPCACVCVCVLWTSYLHKSVAFHSPSCSFCCSSCSCSCYSCSSRIAAAAAAALSLSQQSLHECKNERDFLLFNADRVYGEIEDYGISMLEVCAYVSQTKRTRSREVERNKHTDTQTHRHANEYNCINLSPSRCCIADRFLCACRHFASCLQVVCACMRCSKGDASSAAWTRAIWHGSSSLSHARLTSAASTAPGPASTSQTSWPPS